MVTSTGYQTVGTFILESEVDIIEALRELKKHNSSWSPSEFVVDLNSTLSDPLLSLFPGIVLCMCIVCI
mgnify:FL=1